MQPTMNIAMTREELIRAEIESAVRERLGEQVAYRRPKRTPVSPNVVAATFMAQKARVTSGTLLEPIS